MIKMAGKVLMGLGLAVLASGCVTTQDNAEVVQEREDVLLLREDIARLKGRVEVVDLENQRLQQELERMRNTVAASKGQDGAVQGRLDDLDRKIQSVDAARVKDRQAIIDQISAKMADLLSAGGSGKSSKTSGGTSTAATKRPAGASKAAASGGESSANQAGYEHVVKDGETLAMIAAAYKVKSQVIIDANHLKNPDAIRKGQKLFIPQP